MALSRPLGRSHYSAPRRIPLPHYLCIETGTLTASQRPCRLDPNSRAMNTLRQNGWNIGARLGSAGLTSRVNSFNDLRTPTTTSRAQPGCPPIGHVSSPPIRPSARPFKGLPRTGLSHQARPPSSQSQPEKILSPALTTATTPTTLPTAPRRCITELRAHSQNQVSRTPQNRKSSRRPNRTPTVRACEKTGTVPSAARVTALFAALTSGAPWTVPSFFTAPHGAVPTSAHRAGNASDRFGRRNIPESKPTTTPAGSPHGNGTRTASDCATLCHQQTPGPSSFYETNSQRRRPHQKTAQKQPPTVPFCAKSEQNTNTKNRFYQTNSGRNSPHKSRHRQMSQIQQLSLLYQSQGRQISFAPSPQQLTAPSPPPSTEKTSHPCYSPTKGR